MEKSRVRIPVAREGYPFIVFFLIIVFIFFYIVDLHVVTFVSFLFLLFVIWFFRDPERAIPDGADSLVSPADGKVIKVKKITEEKFTGQAAVKISIFMSLFNVHVNRFPATGEVKSISYNPGKFFSANLDKASLENEQNAILLKTENGQSIVFVQIAGLVARRIVCHVREGAVLNKGCRFGMIRFGSRLDVYLPVSAKVNVKVGDKVKAGVSIIAFWGD